MNYVTVFGRIGNNLFQLSAALKLYGYREGKPNFTADASHIKHTDTLRKFIRDVDLLTTRIKRTSDNHMRGGYYQKLEWALPPDEVRKIMRVRTAPEYDCIVHVRGGDYLKLKQYNESALTRDYVMRAVAKLGYKLEQAVVCTDDPIYTKSIIPECKIISTSIVNDFWTMAYCKNLVMSASTYSWWAGYIGRARRIIFPTFWGYDTELFDRDDTSVNHGIQLAYDRCELQETNI